jgi:acetyl-CoA carboxylase biotin carboxyl carrier protein
MRISFIKQLIDIVEMSNINEIEITRFGTKIRISKNALKERNVEVIEEKEKIKEFPAEKVKVVEEKKEDIKETEDNLHTITSPIVGTFYRAPAPDAPPYVETGDNIKKGDVLCIIEAMKIMNEIESDVSGEVVDVLVANEEPVEFNQALFKIRKK